MHHEARGENDELVREIVGAQKFGRCKVRYRVKANRQVGEACDARKRIGACRLEHELEELGRVQADAENLEGERLADTEPERGQGRNHHGKRNQGNGIEFEYPEGDSHDGAVRQRVENF